MDRKLSATKPPTIQAAHLIQFEWQEDGTSLDLRIHPTDILILRKLLGPAVHFSVSAVEASGIKLHSQEPLYDDAGTTAASQPDVLNIGVCVRDLGDREAIVAHLEVIVNEDSIEGQEDFVVFRTDQLHIPCRPRPPRVSGSLYDCSTVSCCPASIPEKSDDYEYVYQAVVSCFVPENKTNSPGVQVVSGKNFFKFERVASDNIFRFTRKELECKFGISDISLVLIQFQLMLGVLRKDDQTESSDIAAVSNKDMKQSVRWSPPSRETAYVFAPSTSIESCVGTSISVCWSSQLQERAIGLRAILPSARYQVEFGELVQHDDDPDRISPREKDANDITYQESNDRVGCSGTIQEFDMAPPHIRFVKAAKKMRKLNPISLQGLSPGVAYMVRTCISFRQHTSTKVIASSAGSCHQVNSKPMVPSCPSALKLSHYVISDNIGRQIFIKAKWHKSNGNGTDIAQYVVEVMRPLQEMKHLSDERWEVVHVGQATSCVLSATLPRGVQTVKSIHVRVRAQNSVGMSPATSTTIKLHLDSKASIRHPKQHPVVLEYTPKLSAEEVGTTDPLPAEAQSMSSPFELNFQNGSSMLHEKHDKKRGRNSTCKSPLAARTSSVQVFEMFGPNSGNSTRKFKSQKTFAKSARRKAKRRVRSWKDAYNITYTGKTSTCAEKTVRPTPPPKGSKTSPKTYNTTMTQSTKHRGGEVIRRRKQNHEHRGRGRRIVLENEWDVPSRLFRKRLSLTEYSAEIDKLYASMFDESVSKPKPKTRKEVRGDNLKVATTTNNKIIMGSSENGNSLESQHAKLHLMELKMEASAVREARAAAIELEDKLVHNQAMAAMKLQAEWRGTRTRRDLEAMKAKLEAGRVRLQHEQLLRKGENGNPPTKHNAEQRRCSNASIKSIIETQEEAACLIQSRIRGMQTRRELQKRETEDALIEHVNLNVDTVALTNLRQVRKFEERTKFREKVISMNQIVHDQESEVTFDGMIAPAELGRKSLKNARTQNFSRSSLHSRRSNDSSLVASALRSQDAVTPLPSANMLSLGPEGSQGSVLIRTSLSTTPIIDIEYDQSRQHLLDSHISCQRSSSTSLAMEAKQGETTNTIGANGHRRLRKPSSSMSSDGCDIGNARVARDFPDDISDTNEFETHILDDSVEGFGPNHEKAATYIQSQYRGHKRRTEYAHQVQSATYIQAKIRSHLTRSTFLKRSALNKRCATVLQTQFRGHQMRSHFDHLRRKLVSEVNTVTIKECGVVEANGPYDMAGIENNAMRYMKFGTGSDHESTYVLERMQDTAESSKDAETDVATTSRKFLWTLYRIDDSGNMELLYGNRVEGGSLRPPRRRWQVIAGKTPVPKITWDPSAYTSTESPMDPSRALMNQHKAACIVMESGNEQVHGKYLSSGVSDGVRQFKLQNEFGEFCLRRVTYDGSKLWVLIGTLYDGDEKAYFVNPLPTDFPPEESWGLAQDGIAPLPLIVHQKSLQAQNLERKSWIAH